MQLIVGLGNPSKEYENTRHNAGFFVLDEFAKFQSADAWKEEKKFSSAVSVAFVYTKKVLLAKPLTYMNNSGDAVFAIAQYHKIAPRDIVVIHDDLDLPLGKLRISQNASAAGHNGVQSIIDKLRSQDITRFRIGIGRSSDDKKTAQMEPKDFVLQKFSTEEKAEIDATARLAIEALETTVVSGAFEAMNQYN